MSRIIDYIAANSDAKIRNRAKDVFVGKIIFSEDKDSAKALVQGSQGNFYEVIYYGLKHGFMTTSCTCPYDWGGICKHVVAMGNQCATQSTQKKGKTPKRILFKTKAY